MMIILLFFYCYLSNTLLCPFSLSCPYPVLFFSFVHNTEHTQQTLEHNFAVLLMRMMSACKDIITQMNASHTLNHWIKYKLLLIGPFDDDEHDHNILANTFAK